MSTFDLTAEARRAFERKLARTAEAQRAQAEREAAKVGAYIEQASAFWMMHLPADLFRALGTPIPPQAHIIADGDAVDLAFSIVPYELRLCAASSTQAYLTWSKDGWVSWEQRWPGYEELGTALLELIGEWLAEEEQLADFSKEFS